MSSFRCFCAFAFFYGSRELLPLLLAYAKKQRQTKRDRERNDYSLTQHYPSLFKERKENEEHVNNTNVNKFNKIYK